MTAYRVAGYGSRRAFLLDRPKFTVIVSGESGGASALDCAMERAQELGEAFPDLRHFRIEPVPERPAA